MAKKKAQPIAEAPVVIIEKEKEKEKDASTAAMMQINIQDFVATRDSVVNGLSTLQAAVQDLSRAYVSHTSTILGHAPPATLRALNVSLLQEPERDGNAANATTAAQPGAPAEDVKPKKKKRAHDPNAPKRPLTPYFLYMQTARPIISSDLGDVPKKMVGDEGAKRWGAMGEAEKDMWRTVYKNNMASYRGRMAVYKKGENWKALDDAAAAQLANETGAAAEHDDDIDMDAVEDEEMVPPKAPTPPTSPKATNKRRKTTKDAEPAAKTKKAAAATSTPAREDKNTSPVVSKTPVPVPSATAESAKQEKEKKKRKAPAKKGKAAEEAAEPTPAKTPVDSPKKKPKRKRKSEAIEE